LMILICIAWLRS